jgi:hypothetical protein
MKNATAIVITLLLGFSAGLPANADTGHCSVASLQGRWIFATEIGQQMLGGPFPADKDITAIGTLNVGRNGTVSGTFDATVEDTFFLPGIEYTGSITLNRDCIGTVTFITTAGTARTDTIALVARDEILGMSQDPANLWTYQARRLPSFRGRFDHD